MGKYRHRRLGIIVEAVQFHPRHRPWPEGVIPRAYSPHDESYGYIETDSGPKPVRAKDWIISCPDGEKDRCTPLDFPHYYEPVSAWYESAEEGQIKTAQLATITAELEHEGVLYRGTLYPVEKEAKAPRTEAFMQKLDALGVKARQQTTDDGSLFIILSDGGGHGTGATFDAALIDWISCLLKKA